MKLLQKDNSLMLFGLDANKSSAKGAWAFIFTYIFASILGAIFTPLAYWLVQYLNSVYPDVELYSYLTGKGVDKFFDRARWIAVIIALPFIFRYCGLNSVKSLGLSLNKNAINNFKKYFLLGFSLMLIIYTLQYAFTNVSIKEVQFGDLFKIFLNAFLGASILALLEELIFRGLIMRCFYTAWGVLPAVLLSSLFFAYKHFKVPSSIWENIDGGLFTAHWYTGFLVAYYDAIGVFLNFKVLEFFSLTLFGIFLCIIYIRSKSLYAPIAFHFSAVFAILCHRKFFEVGEDNMREFFGNAGATNSYIAIILLLILLVFMFFSKKKDRNADEI